MSLFSLATLLAQSATSPVTIRVPVRLVTAPALVFSKDGHFLPGLQRTDFHVFDNGRLQEVNLDDAFTPVSVALAVQVNQDVLQYVPFISKAGSVIESLLVGESGEAAVIVYSGEVTIAKPFETGDVQLTLRNISVNGRLARMIDAGLRAITLLKERARSRARILIFIGQPMDSGSESSLAALREQAERENVSIYALTLPEFSKAFVSDTFSLEGVSRAEKGGFKASADLGNLIAVIRGSSKVGKGTDPFSILTTATGGTQLHFRKQIELENAIATIGLELRSAYLLSYSPSSTEAGYHTINIEVDVPGAKAYSRPGYWLAPN